MAGLDGAPKPAGGRQLIDKYGDGGFKIAGQRYAGSVIVFPTLTVAWPVTSADEITGGSLAPLMDRVRAKEETVRILVVGGGRRFAPPPARLTAELSAEGIVLEWMDTGAACRTFNVLLLEGREVAAALLAVE
ncbi:MAG: Mth938-like domain-containing protein [Rhodospirillales bacterium]